LAYDLHTENQSGQNGSRQLDDCQPTVVKSIPERDRSLSVPVNQFSGVNQRITMNRFEDIEALSVKISVASEPFQQLIAEIGKVIVGQPVLIRKMLIALLGNGHLLIEGVPGLAKTTAVACLAKGIATHFQRIQFTPDLLPADLIGTQIYRPQDQQFAIQKGPIFSNLILADEINRAPAKVQSALLEAMQERQVTIGGETFRLEEPFLVMATQNPVEQEGTYPLPEAQVDRFMLKVVVDYPTRDQELEILRRMSKTRSEIDIQPVMTPQQLIAARDLVDQIYVDPKVEEYIVDLVVATRDPAGYGLPQLRELIQFGASPRATINLTLAAKSNAFLNGRGYLVPQDVKDVAADVLRHRILLSYEAEAEERTAEDLILQILTKVPVP
jgi:MoxR-like ATPase